MKRVVVINVVGLTQGLIGKNTPAIKQFSEKGTVSSFPPAFPAVTCTAQSSYLTGGDTSQHGVVGNGWYDREAAEVKFWKQSNHIVHGEKLWEKLHSENSEVTCSKMFWWYNMYSTADWAATPRPLYPADGRKVFDIHTQPMTLREEMKAELGEFPFPSFWGPAAGILSSRWIADAAMWIENKEKPTINLVYLPHLDYCLQQYGPDALEVEPELQAIDEIVGEMIRFYEACNVEVVMLSEYGISKVDQAVHLNREFRKRGWIQVKDELGLETLDCGACQVFAVADHQVAHIYINNPAIYDEVYQFLEQLDGVDEVRIPREIWPNELDPVAVDRAGDFIAIAAPNAWFTYYFWKDDALAPDYARCIDIHRKPGYDPVELFLDPEIKFPKLKIALFLLKKKLGWRGLMNVIPLKAELIKGSHGRDKLPESEQPVFISSKSHDVNCAEDVFSAIYDIVNITDKEH